MPAIDPTSRIIVHKRGISGDNPKSHQRTGIRVDLSELPYAGGFLPPDKKGRSLEVQYFRRECFHQLLEMLVCLLMIDIYPEDRILTHNDGHIA